MSETERAALDALVAWIKAEMEYEKLRLARSATDADAIAYFAFHRSAQVFADCLIVEREGR